MPKKHRLTGKDIRAGSTSRRRSSALFSLQVLRAHTSRARMAFVVSKKVSPKAVERNRIKRLCRAAAQPLLAALPPGSYVVHVKAAAAQAPHGELSKDLRALLK